MICLSFLQHWWENYRERAVRAIMLLFYDLLVFNIFLWPQADFCLHFLEIWHYTNFSHLSYQYSFSIPFGYKAEIKATWTSRKFFSLTYLSHSFFFVLFIYISYNVGSPSSIDIVLFWPQQKGEEVPISNN